MQDKISKGLRGTIAGIILNFILALIKGIAGILGNSYALIADAIESTADIFTSLIVWVGLKVSMKEPDRDHPYGHGKAEPVAAFVVGLFLFSAAILIAIQSIKMIFTPHPSPRPFTLIILGVVVLSKEIFFRKLFKTGTEIESHAVKADAFHHRIDALTSLAAFIGISIALVGGEKYATADDWAALISSFVIAYNGYLVFSPALGEIMDVAPPDALLEEIRETAKTVAGVKGVEKAFLRKMGFYYFLDLHLLVSGDITVTEGHRISHQVKDVLLVRHQKLRDVLIHIEPF
jgi:cation diffusion facilitator family transporter